MIGIDIEIWKQIQGFEGLYEISNKGRVKSLPRKIKTWNGFRTTEYRILNPYTTKLGYKRVFPHKETGKKRFAVHRLVAIAFIPNPMNKPYIDHIDGNPSNNNINNLRWVTAKENQNNPICISRQSIKAKARGMPVATRLKAHQAIRKKVRMCDKQTGDTINVFNSVIQAARVTGICATGISAVCQGHRKSAGGYKWKLI